MLDFINELAEVQRFDGIKPVTKKELKLEIAESRLNEATIFLQLNEIYKKLEMELPTEAEIHPQAVDLARVTKRNNEYQRNVDSYHAKQAGRGRGGSMKSMLFGKKRPVGSTKHEDLFANRPDYRTV